MRNSLPLLFAAALTIAVNVGLSLPASAQSFFGSYGSAGAILHVPFVDGPNDHPQTRIIVRPPIERSIRYGSRAYCVRTCDGRFFPVSVRRDESSKDVCKSVCPAAETKVYSGRSIETATSDGKPYSKFANAFRYRNESVPGCSCQSDARAGMSHIRIEDDKTIRIGDIVAMADGLMVASGTGRKGIIFARVSAARIKAERLPEVATR